MICFLYTCTNSRTTANVSTKAIRKILYPVRRSKFISRTDYTARYTIIIIN